MKTQPLAYQTDVLIAGGGLCALPMAKRLARMGLRVLIVEATTSLCHEITRTLRYFAPESALNSATAERYFPGAYMAGQSAGGEVPLHPDALKRGAEDFLLSCGVKILYNLQLCTCENTGEGWHVVLGGKGGLFHAHVKVLLDCTENNITADLLPAVLRTSVLQPRYRQQQVTRCLEYTGLTGPISGTLAVPEPLRVMCGESVKLHPGAYDRNHGYIEVSVNCEQAANRRLDDDMDTEYTARRVSLDVCARLRQQTETLREGQICMAAKQVARLEPLDPMALLRDTEKLAAEFTEDSALGGTCLCIHNQRSKEEVSVRPSDQVVDIAVAGGGPAGAPAAWAAASRGAAVHLYDMNDELGGAGTSGAVRWYWFGLRRGFTRLIDERTGDWEDRLGWRRSFYAWGKDDGWSTELKAMALWELCHEAGVTVNLGCFIVDALVSKNKLTGLVVSTPYGLISPKCLMALDCTGDGDLAAFSGVPVIYGNQRDQMTLWAAYAPLKAPMQYAGDFSTTVAVDDPLDRTRFILSERRRTGISSEHSFDHADYLAPRESRHMAGAYTISLEDQLLQRFYPDTIAVAFSNNDPKGISTADVMNIGLLPPNLMIRIPYRSLLPEKIDGLLVACRAISCTHDASCAVRMQDDMQNVGGAAGFAAAICVARNTQPRMVPLDQLQSCLLDIGTLTASDLQPAQMPLALSDAVNKIATGNGMQWGWQDLQEKTLDPDPVALICSAPAPQAVPLLLAKKKSTAVGPARLLLDRLLVFHNCAEGLDGVLAEIGRSLRDGLPGRQNVKAQQILPDHNMMPETAFLLHNLAFCRTRRVLTAVSSVVDRLCDEALDFTDNTKGYFYYFHGVAYCAERLCFPEFVPMIKKLLMLDVLQNTQKSAFIERSVVPERLAYLALILNRALACCGNVDGYRGLIAFLADKRAILKRCARQELKRLMGKDFGYNETDWQNDLATTGSLPVMPWQDPIV